MSDAFGSFGDAPDFPAREFVAVTPNDSADLARIPKALWISAAGTLSVIGAGTAANSATALGSLSVGTLVPGRVRRVMATGTTATVIALY